MSVFYVTTRQKRSKSTDGLYAINFECEHDSVDALFSALKDGPVIGNHLELEKPSRSNPDQRHKVVGRARMILYEASYIKEPTIRFYEDV